MLYYRMLQALKTTVHLVHFRRNTTSGLRHPDHIIIDRRDLPFARISNAANKILRKSLAYNACSGTDGTKSEAMHINHLARLL